MIVPPEPASFSDDELDAVADALKWQVASARSAAAKHRARLIDQLDFPEPGAGDADEQTKESPQGG